MDDYRAPEHGVAVPKPRRHEGRISVLLRRTVTNLPIRVPSSDWAAVATGTKGMFRCYSESGRDRTRPVVPADTECPRPCLLFSARHPKVLRARRWEALPGVLLSHRHEPLGSITPEDLAREGFEFLPAFRFYWKQRHKRLGWRPWDMVSVLEVRPMAQGDFDTLGEQLLYELYGEWLPRSCGGQA